VILPVLIVVAILGWLLLRLVGPLHAGAVARR
jgi:hypothetical protein